MVTERLFREVLKDSYINSTIFTNGSSQWEFICRYRDYSLLRHHEHKESFVIAWKAEFTKDSCTWEQGHYLMDTTFDNALKEFRSNYMQEC